MHAAVELHNQGELDKAQAIYHEVLAIDEKNFYALNFCGCIQRIKKNYEEGVSLLGRALELQPSNPNAHYNLGNIYKDLERWVEAIKCYESTLSIQSEYPEALNNLGICLMQVE